MDKPKQQKKEVQTYVSCPASPESLSMRLNSFFVLVGLSKSVPPKKQKTTKQFRAMSPVQPLLSPFP